MTGLNVILGQSRLISLGFITYPSVVTFSPVISVADYYDSSSSESSGSTSFKLLVVPNARVCSDLVLDDALFGF